MNESTYKAFVEKIQEDPELRQRLEAEADDNGVPLETVARIAAGEGYEFSVEDAGAELSDEQLNEVSGGVLTAGMKFFTVAESRYLKGEVYPKIELYQGTGGTYLKWF